jgi:hypothetical protein
MVTMSWIALFVAPKEQQKHPMVVAMAHLLPFCHPVSWDHFAVAITLSVMPISLLLRKFMGLLALLLKTSW